MRAFSISSLFWAVGLLRPTVGHGQNQRPVNPSAKPKDAEMLVNCRSVEGLSKSFLRQLNAHMRCRVDLSSLTCLPGLRLSVDQHDDFDLCLSAKQKPVIAPQCRQQNPQAYRTEIIKRGRYPVIRAPNPEQMEVIDIPFTVKGETEILVQTKPLIRKGPDACVYVRQVKQVFLDPDAPLTQRDRK